MKIKLKLYNSIGKEELKAASKVISSGKLSEFVAGKSNNFLGGKNINKFENYLKSFYKVKHAITLNSWTSGLIAIVGALDIEPGDEVIVTPWSMCATSTAILHWNAIPVFADIEKDTFNIDPVSVKKRITNKTKAIIAADIFGHPCNIKELKKITYGKNIKIVTDSAQAPYALNHKSIVGTKSDVGGFSLNYHKIINTGEGGVVVTNNKRIAERVRLIRNHGECNVTFKSKKDLSNIIGHNFRMGEIEAAIGLEQYKKLKKIIKKRYPVMKKLIIALKTIPFIRLPIIKKNCTHNFYIFPIILDYKKISATRKEIVSLLQKYGLKGVSSGYTNLHLLPMFQKKIAYGTKNFPWSLTKKKFSYKKGICPVSEELHDKSFINFEVCLYDLSMRDIKNILTVFKKVWEDLGIINKNEINIRHS